MRSWCPQRCALPRGGTISPNPPEPAAPLPPAPFGGTQEGPVPAASPVPCAMGGSPGQGGMLLVWLRRGKVARSHASLGLGMPRGGGRLFFFLTNSQKFGDVQRKNKPFLQHGGKRVIDLALKAQGSPFPAGAGPILPGHRQPHAGDGSSWPPLPGARPLFPAAFSSRDKTHLCWP